MVERVTEKIIKSGNVLEYYSYSDGYLKGYSTKNNNGGRKKNYVSEDFEENRIKVLNRAKKDLRRLINSNFNQYGNLTSKFLTLTFADDIRDLKCANYEFKKFLQRLNYRVNNSKKNILKYTCVVEFHKSGCIHYHVIFYNLPYLKSNEISDLWRNGFIKINKINNVDNVGTYVASYLGQVEKGQGRSPTDNRLQNNKSYFSSKGLFKPIEVTDKKKIEQFAPALSSDNLKYSNQFESEYLGTIAYKQYILKK